MNWRDVSVYFAGTEWPSVGTQVDAVRWLA